MRDWQNEVRDVLDFPKPGIVFKDITPLLKNPQAVDAIATEIAQRFANERITAVAGVEARGFIFAPLIAQKLQAAFVPIRKPGKLPFSTISKSYDLEYGQASVELHTDAVSQNDRVLVVDDLLATGGTMNASCELIEELGGHVAGCAFVIELLFLAGRNTLSKYEVFSLMEV